MHAAAALPPSPIIPSQPLLRACDRSHLSLISNTSSSHKHRTCAHTALAVQHCTHRVLHHGSQVRDAEANQAKSGRDLYEDESKEKVYKEGVRKDLQDLQRDRLEHQRGSSEVQSGEQTVMEATQAKDRDLTQASIAGAEKERDLRNVEAYSMRSADYRNAQTSSAAEASNLKGAELAASGDAHSQELSSAALLSRAHLKEMEARAIRNRVTGKNNYGETVVARPVRHTVAVPPVGPSGAIPGGDAPVVDDSPDLGVVRQDTRAAAAVTVAQEERKQ